MVLHDPTRGSPPSRGLRNTTRAMAFSSLRCVRLEKDVFRSLVGRWCNKHPWSSVPFSSYATSMKPRAVGPSLLAPPPEGGLLSFTSMRPCGSHRPPLRFFYMAPSVNNRTCNMHVTTCTRPLGVVNKCHTHGCWLGIQSNEARAWQQ